MKYELLIYVGKHMLSALDVDGDRIQYISMSGNAYHPADDINGFYEHILDYYNVDDLSEINAGIRIVNGGTVKKNIDFLFKKFIKVDNLSIWKVEELIPVILINKDVLDQSGDFRVKVYDCCYKVVLDEKHNITISNSDHAEIELRLEDFNLLNKYNATNYIIDKMNIFTLHETIGILEESNYEYETTITKMKTTIEEQEQKITFLNSEKDSLKHEINRLNTEKQQLLDKAQCNGLRLVYTDNDKLSRVIEPNGKVTQFGYTDGKLSYLIDHNGKTYRCAENEYAGKSFEEVMDIFDKKFRRY